VSAAGEPPRFYQRHSLNVETYDLRAAADIAGTDIDGDVDFYVEQAGEVGGPVLELGCGTGRVSWPLARAGFEVVGLDRSRAMLDAAEAKRPTADPDVSGRIRFVEGDMTDFTLPDRFALAFIPFRAFLALLEPDLQRSCLECVRRHLELGGRLIVDVFDPRLEWLGADVTSSPRDTRPTVHPPTSGRDVAIDVLSRTNDPFRQVMSEEWRFRELQADGSAVREEHERLELRWIYRQEMRYLLELAGFEVVAEYGDMHGAPPAYGREQIWVASVAAATRRTELDRERRP
jgi:SAM-dependent methyltransferase